jgi:hypothetical protein
MQWLAGFLRRRRIRDIDQRNNRRYSFGGHGDGSRDYVYFGQLNDESPSKRGLLRCRADREFSDSKLIFGACTELGAATRHRSTNSGGAAARLHGPVELGPYVPFPSSCQPLPAKRPDQHWSRQRGRPDLSRQLRSGELDGRAGHCCVPG